MDLIPLLQLIQAHPWATLGGGALLLSVVIYLAGIFLPGILVGWIHRLFAAAKASPWWRDPAHPKRARWLLATAELAEDEIPEPGTGGAIYAAWGAAVAALSPLLMGTAGRWAAAFEKVGDAVDLELDAQVKDLAAVRVDLSKFPWVADGPEWKDLVMLHDEATKAYYAAAGKPAGSPEHAAFCAASKKYSLEWLRLYDVPTPEAPAASAEPPAAPPAPPAA